MRTRRTLSTVLMLVLAFSVVGCNSGGGNPPGRGGNNANPGIGSGNLDGECSCGCEEKCDPDTCECTLDCICETCECCAASGGLPKTYTFQVEIYAYVAGWRPIHRTSGISTVTIINADGSGYSGSAEGAGEYTEQLIPETGQVDNL